MDFDGLMQSHGFSAINILPKQFNQAHRVLEFNIYDSHGGCDCYVRGFIARTMVDTEAKANSSGLIVGHKTDKSGDVLLFRPFSGAPKDKVFEVHQQHSAAIKQKLTSAFRLLPTRCPTWTLQSKVHIPDNSRSTSSHHSIGPLSLWSSASPPTEPSSYFKEGDRVTLRDDIGGDEHFNPRFFAGNGEQVVTGVVLFALPPKGSKEQRCVLVAHESDNSYQQAFFFRGTHLKLATEYPVYQPGDRVRLSRSALSQGCIAGTDSYGLVVHVGDIRDRIQRNVLVACVQTGKYSLYPASSLLPCSSSLFISSESERESLVSELIRLNPTLGEFGISEDTIKGLMSQFGSNFW